MLTRSFTPWRRRRDELSAEQSPQVSLLPLRRSEVAQAEEVVAGDPVAGVHVASMLERPGRSRQALWGFRRAGRLAALGQRHRGLSFAVDSSWEDDPRLLEAMAEFVRQSVGLHEVMFGPEPTMRRLLERFTPAFPRPIELRRQNLMHARHLLRPAGPAPIDGLELRTAQPGDLTWLLAAHAAMCREDLGVDQVSRYPEAYAEYFRQLIRAGTSLVGTRDGVLVFKAEYPVESRDVRLIEGVFTVPEHRGLGIAGWAMRKIAFDTAFAGRSAALYVNQRNDVAMRLYRRIGFRIVREWMTVLLGHESWSPRQRPLEV